MDVKTIDIELAIMKKEKFNQKLIVPNITSMAGALAFECDMFVLSNSGYATGFEIKITKSDLKNDLNKKHIREINKVYPYNGKTGFEKYYRKLKYFNYAVPKFLEEEALKQIPDFCGLYIYTKSKDMFCKRKPKKIFDYKWSKEEEYNIARLGAMRIYTLKKNIQKLQK